MPFSNFINRHPEAQNPSVRARITIAKQRIQSILDRQVVAHKKTLEQKISEQGPTTQRVDPHLVSLAVKDLLELNRLKEAHHAATGNKPWYANIGTLDQAVNTRLAELAPLYSRISTGGFPTLVGDALEVIVFKCIRQRYEQDRLYAYNGHFYLDRPKKADGRYQKEQPPKVLGGARTDSEADFILYGYGPGPVCVECKNYREWLYPHSTLLSELIIKASELDAIPLLVARRLHYTTKTNFLQPAGILAHETLLQYYPADQAELARQARDKNTLGFTDITATEEPHARNTRFFNELLPVLIEDMARRWRANQDVLFEYATGQINLAQLYNAIGSPAAGNWQEPELDEQPDDQ